MKSTNAMRLDNIKSQQLSDKLNDLLANYYE